MKRISFKDSNGLNLTREVLAGRKTMTRRIVTLPDNWNVLDVHINYIGFGDSIRYFLDNSKTDETLDIYPKYFPGEVVAIQQAYKDVLACEHLSDDQEDEVCRLVSEGVPGCTNKMFVRADLMPHHIKITDVRCEWLQDISDEDCIREGITESVPYEDGIIGYSFPYNGDNDYYFDTPRRAFVALFDKVIGFETWKSNPIIWVYKFELVD